MTPLARLKAATAGSRELDELVWFAVGGEQPAGLNGYFAPFYTTSLDAARTLVPADFQFYVAQEPSHAHACVWQNGVGGKIAGGCTDVSTVEIALVIAALTARAALSARTAPGAT